MTIRIYITEEEYKTIKADAQLRGIEIELESSRYDGEVSMNEIRGFWGGARRYVKFIHQDGQVLNEFRASHKIGSAREREGKRLMQ